MQSILIFKRLKRNIPNFLDSKAWANCKAGFEEGGAGAFRLGTRRVEELCLWLTRGRIDVLVLPVFLTPGPTIKKKKKIVYNECKIHYICTYIINLASLT